MISYTQKNPTAARLAIHLYYSLRDLGHNVWLDVKQDDKSEAAMQRAVENARFVIAIISDGAGVEGLRAAVRRAALGEGGGQVHPARDRRRLRRGSASSSAWRPTLRDLGSVDFVDLNQNRSA